MRTEHDNPMALEVAIQAWAHCVGVDDPRPVAIAVQKANSAYEHGASVAEAAGVARGFVLCWQRHPANTRRAELVVA